MIVLISLIIVIILLFALIYYLSHNTNNNKKYDNSNDDDELIDDIDFNEEELEKLGENNLIENFDEIIPQNEYDISKEDYQKIRNDIFNNQFFNFFNRLNNSSDNVDNSVEKINRFRNSKFGFTNESAIGMKLKDVSDYLIKN